MITGMELLRRQLPKDVHSGYGFHVQIGNDKAVKSFIRHLERLVARVRRINTTKAHCIQNARGDARHGGKIVDH
jgi:hypothetical protein